MNRPNLEEFEAMFAKAGRVTWFNNHTELLVTALNALPELVAWVRELEGRLKEREYG